MGDSEELYSLKRRLAKELPLDRFIQECFDSSEVAIDSDFFGFPKTALFISLYVGKGDISKVSFPSETENAHNSWHRTVERPMTVIPFCLLKIHLRELLAGYISWQQTSLILIVSGLEAME